ncbi:MAG: hypothetical protein FJ056_02590 [Cyanobacteria bacterium M_surface_10_m2_179]|nr:hypothetical protein [Cyanobacteria bacterium M_surface_10_m2_179]
MSSTVVDTWSDTEQAIARTAFETAYGRTVSRLVSAVQTQAAGVSDAQSVWALHDFLSIERHTIEGRFDFRLEGILFVFASMVKEQLLQLEELEGLTPDKLAKVAAMSRF